MRITLFGNSPFASTGYGNQFKLFAPLIQQLGHDVNIQAFYGHEMFCSPINWNGIPITGRGFHPYGMDVILPHQKMVKSDIFLSLMDAWVFDPEVINQVRWVPWFPVDSDPLPPPVFNKVRHAFHRLVYSRFAEKQLNNFNLDCTYIPHGVDTKVFKPLGYSGKIIAREKIGLPKDAFIVGMVAANKGYPSRKAFEENIAAFLQLKKLHSDAFLFMQTMAGEDGRECVNLPGYCQAIGLQLGKDVLFCDQYVNGVTGFPDEYMVDLYNAMDVLLSVSRGEGFGIPILEAQACGTPVITGDWTAMGEITFSGWKVDREDTTPEFTRLSSYQFIPHIGAIVEKLIAAYNMRGNDDYAKRARKGAEAFDVRKITEKFWKPTLEGIAERIGTIEKLKAQVADHARLNVKEIKA